MESSPWPAGAEGFEPVLAHTQVLQADAASRRNLLIAVQEAKNPGSADGAPTPQSLTRDTYGTVTFDVGDNGEVTPILHSLLLPANSPLSVLAIELLPIGTPQDNPLGLDLGNQRILRVSPLTAIPAAC